MVSENETTPIAQPDESELKAAMDYFGYDVVCHCESGAQGAVYVALEKSTGREVAIKLDRVTGEAAGVRLERERRCLSRLSHPSIVKILDSGRVLDRRYIVTEFIDGFPVTSHAFLQQIDARAAVELFCKIADAMGCIHRHRIVHRDLKPSNIIVTREGVPHIVDFGLSYDTTRSSGISEPGLVVGTLRYLSPEQIDGARGDPRSDVFALGVVFYETLAQASPFPNADSRRLVLADILQGHIIPLRKAVAAEDTNEKLETRAVCGDLEAIIGKCMRLDPDERYQNATDLAADLKRHTKGQPVHARIGQHGDLLRAVVRRYRPYVISGAIAVLALAVGLVASIQANQTTKRASVQTERAYAQAQTALEMAGLLEYGEAARGSGRIDAAVRDLESAISLGESIESPTSDVQLRLFSAHHRLAELHYSEGLPLEGRFHALLAINLFEAAEADHDDPQWRARAGFALAHNGKLAYQAKEYNDAASAWMDSADRFREFGDEISLAWALTRAGQSLYQSGRPQDAFVQYTQSLQSYDLLLVARPTSSELLMNAANTANYLAAWHLRRKTADDDRTALALIEDALARLDRITDPTVSRDAAHVRPLLERNRALALRRIDY